MSTKQYTANAQLLVQPQSGGVSLSLSGTNQTISPTDVATELQLISSAPVKNAVQAKLHLVPKIGASQVGQTNVISLAATSTRPKQAALIANVYAREFVSYERQVTEQNLASAEEQLQNQISAIDEQITNAKAGTPVQTALANQEAVLKTQLAQLEVNGAVTTGGVELVSPASAPKSPSSPKKTEDGLLGLLVGLIAGLGVAFVVDYLDDAVYTKSDLERVAPDVPVLAMVPMVTTWKEPDKPFIITLSDPLSPVSESYRSLRTSLHFAGHDGSMKTILVTSPMATEGKTSTIANLGIVLAKAGQSVVVVSADLRRPRLAKFFGVSDGIGLTSVIIGDANLSDALQPVDGAPGLVVLPAGPLPPNPAELLASNKMREVIDALRERYDIVLIDSPPLLPVTDPVVLAQQADATLVVVASSQTKKGQLQHAVDQLVSVNARRVGFVLNGITRQGGTGYGYEYGYSYRYGPVSAAASTNGHANGTSNGNGHAPAPETQPRSRRARRAAKA
jgi:capsular exopolysaccharide synthesis family protein